MTMRVNCLIFLVCAIAVAFAYLEESTTEVWPACPFPDSEYSVYFPDLEDCRFFYQCSNGVAIPMMCAPGTVFNATINVCVHPSNPSCVPSLSP